ncbi:MULTISPECIES: hypothetical protein [Planktothricoides]|uniref:Uncharacterized protein n=1 Tax=Planktothricoides raciborskii GIHE-MW2 TaxID=2792601 RepID=A0AAU8JD86_9CYAN|nr:MULTISPECIES: hypothetical protein [Planktothricoides]
MAEAQPRDIQLYITPAGKIPFSKWFDSLQDEKAKTTIDRQES